MCLYWSTRCRHYYCFNNNILCYRRSKISPYCSVEIEKKYGTPPGRPNIYQNQMTVCRKNDRIYNIIIYEYNAFSPLATVIFHNKPERIDHWCLRSIHRTTCVWKYKHYSIILILTNIYNMYI